MKQKYEVYKFTKRFQLYAKNMNNYVEFDQGDLIVQVDKNRFEDVYNRSNSEFHWSVYNSFITQIK